MNQDRNTSFFDPRMLLVIVFCFSCLLLWQSYLVKKYPDYYKRQAPQQNTESPENVQNQDIQDTRKIEDTKENPSTGAISELLLPFHGSNLSFKVSNFGLGLKDIQVNRYKNREGDVVSFSSQIDSPLFATKLLGEKEPLIFDIQQDVVDTKAVFIGHADVGGVKIQKTLTIEDQKHVILMTTHVSGDISQVEGLQSLFSERIQLSKSAVFFLPSYETSGYYVAYGTDSTRGYFSNDDFEEALDRVSLLSIDTHYFTRSILDNSDIFPTAVLSYDHAKQVVSGNLTYHLPNTSESVTIEQMLFIGPKQSEVLTATDARLKDVLDYGFFSWIAHPIMDLTKFFFRLFGNWGIAIILMTLVVRLLLLPFNIISYRSMKKVQAIQPQLVALKEKYKDDKATLNKATMDLMKESGANPIGGCLPMLLQFPVFIALFKVLGNAIEFYQAPFIFWITDLSEPDPYFVLPVLMAVSMILHQKLSPTAPDPNTRKMLLVITVVFSLFMIIYPSGLALYIFIGSLFSILQQVFLLQDKSQVATKLQA